MKKIAALFILFILSLNSGYCTSPVEKKANTVSKEVLVTINDFQHCADNSMVMMGNPSSWWNQWGRQTFAFTGTLAAGIAAGIGIGSVVPGIGTTSGAIVGVVGGLLAAVAVARNTGPEE